MIGTIIGIIVAVIILGIVYWGVQQLLPLLPIGQPFLQIVNVLLTILVAIVAIWIILVLLGMAGIHVPIFGTGGLK